MTTKLMIDRFLSWPLPESLCSDPCASMPGYPHRTGTNLMTAEQAKAMLDYVLAAPRQPEGDGMEVVAWVTPEKDRAITALTEAAAREDGGAMLSSVRPYSVPCMTVAQHNRIVAALSAQQSAHVSVPRELLERICWSVISSSDLHTHNEAVRELRALLNGGEA